jgi:hypothetical protein
MMTVDLLKQIRNLLLRTTMVSLILMWLLVIATVALWDTWTSMTSQWFHTPVSELGPMISNWFALIKFYVLFLLLAPALGLHWEIKRREKSS